MEINSTLPFGSEFVSFIGKDQLPQQCYLKSNVYSADCVYKWFCPQLPAHFVKVGLGLIIAVIIISWLLWAFNKWGYKWFNRIVSDSEWGSKVIGDLTDPLRRAFWIDWINSIVMRVLVGYIVMVVYLSW